MSLGTISLIYFVLMFGSFIVISVMQLKKVKSQEDYLLGGRSFGALSNGLAGMSSYLSEFLFLGMTGAVTAIGFGYTGILFVFLMGSAWALTTTMPQITRSQTFTIMGLLSMRFGRPAYWLIMVITLMFGAMFLIGQFKAMGVTLEFIIGEGYIKALIVAGVALTAYTVIGGMYSVTFTQVVQAIVMLFAVSFPLVLIFKAQEVPNWLNFIYGYSSLSDALSKAGFYQAKQPLIYFVSMIVPGLGFMVAPQGFAIASRSKNPANTRYAIAWLVFWVSLVYAGAMAFAFSATYWGATGGDIKALPSADYILFTMAQKYVPHWVTGIILAGGLAAAVSTLSAMLIFYGTVIAHDILGPVIKDKTDKQKVKISTIATAAVGLIGILVALNPPPLLATPIIWGWEIISVTLVPPVVFYLWWKRTHRWGIWVGLVVGAVLTSMTQGWTGPIIKVKFFGSFLAMPVVLLLIIIISYVAPPESKNIRDMVDTLHGWKKPSDERYNSNWFALSIGIISIFCLWWSLSSI